VEVLERMGHRPDNAAGGVFYRGTGCRQCRQTGYSGRTGIFELLRITPQVRLAILRRGSTAEIASAAPADHEPMREDGFRKVTAGLTTLEEVLRVTQDTATEEALGQ
jgi:type II secretory ATPase GspE/PulE/Tfp pilus assembly ATPase PilB-like protein